MYPTSEQAGIMLKHCEHARFVWNMAVEQHSHWRKHKARYRPDGRQHGAPGFAEQCRQLTEARRENEWLGEGNADVMQQALKDFAKAKNAKFTSGFGEPTWRKRFKHEGFRVIGTDPVPEFEAHGSPKLNAKGKQVMGRSVVIEKLNRRWAQVEVPGCGWVRFRLTRTRLPEAKTFRVTFRNGQWHLAFVAIPDPFPTPGTGQVIGIDRGVSVTAALSDGRKLNCRNSRPKNGRRSASTSAAPHAHPRAASPRPSHTPGSQRSRPGKPTGARTGARRPQPCSPALMTWCGSRS